jgi:hypothetical protein
VGPVRWTLWWAAAFLYLCTAGIAWVVKKSAAKHCPQCKHLLSNHQRRQDGSFRD